MSTQATATGINEQVFGAPLVTGRHSPRTVTETVCHVNEQPTPRAWYVAFGIAVAGLHVLGAMIAYLVFTGVGVWGLNHPVGWAWDITNFVFWIGIGHAGTLISAILCLLRQKWRTSINRAPMITRRWRSIRSGQITRLTTPVSSSIVTKIALPFPGRWRTRTSPATRPRAPFWAASIPAQLEMPSAAKAGRRTCIGRRRCRRCCRS